MKPQDKKPRQTNWSYSPSFLLRRYCVLDAVRGWRAGKFLECGSGTGTMTKLFLENGYNGVGYDIGDEHIEILKQNLSSFVESFRIINDLNKLHSRDFDYLMAFEVLEHVENDAHALMKWSNNLKQGGCLLVSVPARMKKFRDDDFYMGHYRRYEKSTLHEMLTACGFTKIKIRSYGVPLANLTRIVGAYLHRKQMARHPDVFLISREQRSTRSGIERIESINKLSFLFNPVTLWPFKVLQRLFYRFDWGEGYVVTAIKTSEGDLATPK